MYALRVTKFEDNEDYKDQLTQFNRHRQYGYSMNNETLPSKIVEKTHLDVVISDEEYQIIKKEVIKAS